MLALIAAAFLLPWDEGKLPELGFSSRLRLGRAGIPGDLWGCSSSAQPPRFWKARGCVLEPDCSQGVSMEPWEFSRWDFQRGFKQRGNKNLAGVEGRMLFINSEENKAAPCVTKGGAGAPQEHQGR